MPGLDRAVIFGEAAKPYDRYRPEYPAVVFDHIFGLGTFEQALEIGAGTGKATIGFSGRGLEIVTVELSSGMAEVLRARDLPDVTVEVTSFEDWSGAPGHFDLVYAAQAWHWIDPASGYDKVMSLLRPGGVFAIMWNVPMNRYERFVDVYREHGPEILAENDGRIMKRDSPWEEELVAAGFSDTKTLVHPWGASLSPGEFRMLCSTYSDHMMIPEPRRTLLLETLEQAVVESGGWFEVEYEARVFSGYKPMPGEEL